MCAILSRVFGSRFFNNIGWIPSGPGDLGVETTEVDAFDPFQPSGYDPNASSPNKRKELKNLEAEIKSFFAYVTTLRNTKGKESEATQNAETYLMQLKSQRDQLLTEPALVRRASST